MRIIDFLNHWVKGDIAEMLKRSISFSVGYKFNRLITVIMIYGGELSAYNFCMSVSIYYNA